jgi:hypothetical protein
LPCIFDGWLLVLDFIYRVFLLSLVLAGCASFGLSLAYPFVFRVMVPTINFYWIFGESTYKLLIAD